MMLRQEVKTWDRGNSSNCSDYLDLEFLNNHSELSSKIKVSVRLTLRQKLVKLQRQVETALFVPI